MQGARVRAVGLVHQHQDGVVLVQDRELAHGLWRVRDGLGVGGEIRGVCVGVRVAVALLVLLDGGEDEARPLLGQQVLQLLRGPRLLDRLARQLGRVRQLLLEVLAVGDDHDLEAAQGGHRPHLPHEEHHRQALARPLRVPDDAAAPVVLAVLLAGLARQQPLDGLPHRPVLLVAGDDLDGPALGLHEQREVAHEVEQVLGPEHPGHERLLTRQACPCPARRPPRPSGPGWCPSTPSSGPPAPRWCPRGPRRSRWRSRTGSCGTGARCPRCPRPTTAGSSTAGVGRWPPRWAPARPGFCTQRPRAGCRSRTARGRARRTSWPARRARTKHVVA